MHSVVKIDLWLDHTEITECSDTLFYGQYPVLSKSFESTTYFLTGFTKLTGFMGRNPGLHNPLAHHSFSRF